MTGRRHRAVRAAVTLVIVAALVVFARNVDWPSVETSARSADPLLLVAAIVLNLLSLFLKGVRWWSFLWPLGARSFRLAIQATFAGAALNNVLVAQGGEGARVAFVARGSGISSARVLAALALERVLDAVTYLVILVAAAWLLPLPDSIVRWRNAASFALVAAAAALGALVWTQSPNGDEPPLTTVAPDRSRSRTRALVARGRGYARQFAASVTEIATTPRLIVAMLLSVAAWILQIATYDFVARAARLPLPIAGSVAALIVVGVSFLVRATPGNVGIFQLAYLMAVRPFGVSDAPAIAVALLIQAVQVVPTMVGGIFAAPGLLRQRAAERVARKPS